MAKENKQDKDMKEQFRKLVASTPVLPVLSDHPLEEGEAFTDRFELCYKLGPVFNIIRHKDTATPTTIAIYGDWGTGKTSAMRWLEGLIKEWNETGKGKDKTDIKTIWFYPWKYNSRDDVWRGLISEVIIKGTEIKGANIQTVTKAAKQFGLFLGKGFIHTLAALKLRAGNTAIGGEAEFDLSCIKDVIGEYDKNIHPEKAYLNDFENSFEKWLEDTLSTNQRMVIFIDDLDRCMPEIALEVLEALKLYLNIKNLIFVVGVDDKVIQSIVDKHYELLGVGKEKAKHYLAKMFQTEVTVGPSEKQIDDYLNYNLKNIEYFKKPYLDDKQVDLFKELINNLADRNPREVKRLINSAVMSGAGAEMMSEATGKKTNYSFAQGLQVFFIRKIVESEPYNNSRLIGSELGNSFFEQWSKIVRTNIKKNKKFPLYLPIMKEYEKKFQEYKEKEQSSGGPLTRAAIDSGYLPSLPGINEKYIPVIENPRYSEILELLSDERLGKLMQIEFSAEIAEITKEAEQSTKKLDDATIIRNAIAKQLKKEPSELKESDYKAVNELNIDSKEISDISSIANLTNINKLYLYGNQISDISALAKLTNITEILLSNNQIENISTIEKLKKLEYLMLSFNKISNISVLANLTNITGLVLDHNQINDISALAGLIKITELWLENNKISNIKPLSNLKKINRLSLKHNQISDISVLANLTNITRLDLGGNQISYISALANLTKITELNLSRNQISDISFLANLTNITQLHLYNNQISDISFLANLPNITQLSLSHNQISDISVFANLPNITQLYLGENQISDISVLLGLKKLKYLYIVGCVKVTDEQDAELQKALPKLEIIR